MIAHSNIQCSFVLTVLIVALSGCTEAPTTEPTVVVPAPASFQELVEHAVINGETELIVNGIVVNGEDLAKLDGFKDLTHLAVERFEGTTDSLRQLVELPRLKRLQLRGKAIGDDKARVIAECIELNNINLPDAYFTDEGLAELASLPKLELLRFHSPNVTDAGLKSLAKSKSLRFLHLIAVPVTDEGLIHLEAMTQLESLYVDDADITDDGIERLLQALPDLHFHINQQHSDRDPSKGSHPH